MGEGYDLHVMKHVADNPCKQAEGQCGFQNNLSSNTSSETYLPLIANLVFTMGTNAVAGNHNRVGFIITERGSSSQLLLQCVICSSGCNYSIIDKTIVPVFSGDVFSKKNPTTSNPTSPPA